MKTESRVVQADDMYKQYGLTTKQVVTVSINQFLVRKKEISNGLKILKKIMEDASQSISAKNDVKLGIHENDFYRRVHHLLCEIEKEQPHQFMARMSLYKTKKLLLACREHKKTYLALQPLTSYLESNLRLKYNYFCQFQDVKNKVKYWYLIENMQWPLYACDKIDMEESCNLPELYRKAQEIATELSNGEYLPANWKEIDKVAVYCQQFYALKALELGLITLEDFENVILVYAFILDKIAYPSANIQLTLSNIEDVQETGLKKMLCQSRLSFTDEMYQAFLDETKKLPIHQKKILQVEFNELFAPKMYSVVSHNFFKDTGYIWRKACILPSKVFELARSVHFNDDNLTQIKSVLGKISKYQIIKDAQHGQHVTNYNFPSQEELIKADNTDTGHAFFPLHDRDYHVLLLDTIPQNITSWLKWLCHEILEAGLQLSEANKDMIFTMVDCNFYYLREIYKEIRDKHPKWNRQQVHQEMQDSKYGVLPEILSQLFGCKIYTCFVQGNYTHEILEYYTQHFGQSEKPQAILLGVEQKIYYLFPAVNPDIIKTDGIAYLHEWQRQCHYFKTVFEILRKNKSMILKQYGIDVDRLFIQFTFDKPFHYGSENLNLMVRFSQSHTAEYHNLFFSDQKKSNHMSPYYCLLQINSEKRDNINKEILQKVRKIPPIKNSVL